MIMCFKDMPSSENPVTENKANTIMLIALPIGKNILMGNDAPKEWVELMKIKTDLKYQLVQKAKKRPTTYLTAFQQEELST